MLVSSFSFYIKTQFPVSVYAFVLTYVITQECFFFLIITFISNCHSYSLNVPVFFFHYYFIYNLKLFISKVRKLMRSIM